MTQWATRWDAGLFGILMALIAWWKLEFLYGFEYESSERVVQSKRIVVISRLAFGAIGVQLGSAALNITSAMVGQIFSWRLFFLENTYIIPAIALGVIGFVMAHRTLRIAHAAVADGSDPTEPDHLAVS